MLSFVIPAFNEARYLAATLTALHYCAGETGRPYEIIVADDASTDATARIAAAHGAHVVGVAHRQIAATRNAGAAQARGDILLFVDADTIVETVLLRAALAALDSGAIGGGASVRLSGTPSRRERWLTSGFVWLLHRFNYAPGCFIFCTRAAYEAVGGFDESYYAAEDIAISHALSRIGRFAMLREAAITSDRKLRTFSIAEQFALLFRVAFFGRKALRSREALKLWYEDRRTGDR